MARNSLRRYYSVGEKRLIEWDVRPNNENDILVITEARYEVYKGNELIKAGDMTVEDKKVSFIFEAVEKGEFVVKGFVTVPPETISTELIA
jgi:hypothetical protein